VTRHIGLIPVATVTHSEPFHVSKAIATLDVMSAEAVKFLFRWPFQAREFVEQAWFIVL
jgi:hypothetical protein